MFMFEGDGMWFRVHEMDIGVAFMGEARDGTRYPWTVYIATVNGQFVAMDFAIVQNILRLF